jgi:hypothetical protein
LYSFILLSSLIILHGIANSITADGKYKEARRTAVASANMKPQGDTVQAGRRPTLLGASAGTIQANGICGQTKPVFSQKNKDHKKDWPASRGARNVRQEAAVLQEKRTKAFQLGQKTAAGRSIRRCRKR